MTTDDLAKDYAVQAERALKGGRGDVARGLISGFAGKISSISGVERDKKLEELAKTLNKTTPEVIDTIPAEEQNAFALALVREYQKSVH